MMTKNLTILGSTGSIGRQTLEVVEQLPVRVAALTAGQNVERMAEQCRRFRPQLAVMGTEEAAQRLREALAGEKIEIRSGMDGLIAAAEHPLADTVVTAVVGMLGLRADASRPSGRKSALPLPIRRRSSARASSLCARLRRPGRRSYRSTRSTPPSFSVFMGCRDRSEIRRLILTCSGGPFFGKTPDKLRQVTKADALRHPNWKMGEKITIDCATLMNKGLEVIEAMRLYGLPLSQVDVVIHRQSIVHSLVEFHDGAVLAQLGVPDMRVPIRLALTYPNRAENPAEPLDLLRCGPLTFDAPDEEAFPCFRLAKQAAQTGGTACAVLNGANETAVAHYLRGECGFYDIPRMSTTRCRPSRLR